MIQSKEIVNTPIERIVPNPKNANKHPKEQIERLAKIIEYQGFREPLMVSKRSGFLVSGHGRLEAAQLLGMEELPVMFQDFESEAQEYAHMIADNEIARWAEFDHQAFYSNIDILGELDFDLTGIQNFKVPDLEDLENYEPEKDDIKKFKIEVQFSNEMERDDLHDDLLSKGFMVKKL